MLVRTFLIFTGLSFLFTGAIFGFFYAFFASVLNGFDTIDGALAIDAMNAINREVRNVRFFPIFFLTPVIAVITAGLGWAAAQRRSAMFFLGAGVVYVAGAMAPTIQVSVPLNVALMTVDVTAITSDEAAEIWNAYSRDWAWWNGLRTLFSGVALALCGGGIWVAAKDSRQS